MNSTAHAEGTVTSPLIAKSSLRIAVAGTGFLGGSMLAVLGELGFMDVIPYDIGPHSANAPLLASADAVFVCVPTPSVRGSQDLSAVRSVLALCSADRGRRQLAVIRSTVRPDYLEALAAEFPWLDLVHVPEFLDAGRALEMAREPYRNVIGWRDLDQMSRRGFMLSRMLPEAPTFHFSLAGAAMVKYFANAFFASKNVFMNAAHDCAAELPGGFGGPQAVLDAVCADPRIGTVHGVAVLDGGRGAGGACLIKDTAAARDWAFGAPGGALMADLLSVVESQNFDRLKGCGKDAALLSGVYGEAEPGSYLL